MNSAEALSAIDELDKFGINLGLSRVESCLSALGNPERSYPTVHVGGTNGKGSTSAFTAEILKSAGYRTGLYTSPPLRFFGERMRIDGVVMDDSRVPSLYGKVMEASRSTPAAEGMTQFEVITAMAFLYFAEEKVDAAVIEVGLGGRLDSTNVIVPVASAITNIGLEHSAYLGGTVEAIAAEKGGIAKAGVPFATTAALPALSALKAAASRAGAPFKAYGGDFTMEEGADGWIFRGTRIEVGGIRSGLPGPFQKKNLALSLAMIEELAHSGWRVSEEHIRAGARNAKWPGRLELFKGEPPILLDGAHNPHAAEALAEALRDGFPRNKLILVLGILDDKDAESILESLTPLADRVILTRSASRRAIDPAELARRADAVMKGAVARPDVGSAILEAQRGSDASDLIVVTGSLTLVGEASGWLEARGCRS